MKKEKIKKKIKEKPEHGFFSCMKWLIRRVWMWDKIVIFTSVIVIPVALILHALGLYIPTIVLEVLQESESFNTIALTIFVVLLAQFIFRIAQSVIDELFSSSNSKSRYRMYHELMRKSRCVDDYYMHYVLEYEKIYDRVLGFLDRDGSLSDNVIKTARVIINILNFLLFSSIISLLNPWIILILIAGSVINFLAQRYQQNKDHKVRDELNANYKKFYYLTWQLPVRTRHGKDIRVYNYADLIDKKGNGTIKEHTRLMRYKHNSRTVVTVISLLVSAIRDAVAYGYLIYGVVNGTVNAAEFVLYFSAISQISGFIGSIIGYFSDLRRMSLGISDFITFFDKQYGKLNKGEGIPLPKGRPLSVEFRNVTFKYPQGENNVLENVSFKIEPGEKISLVGMNGAGKTTITKLMCGLFIPDEGEVLIDGHSVLEYNRDELYTLFSVVPQEYSFLPTSIAENISACPRNEIDENRLWECLDKAGIGDRIRSLPKGIDTSMSKQFDVDAASFSGGETQKILLARALYRSAPILILDEPTAALDPIAEDRMYQMYGSISENATSVFISHRLASTRFCDRIYLLDGANFAECGTHKELMENGGKYKELFDVQSKYYKEEVTEYEE